MDIKRVERIVEHVGVGDGPDGCLLHLRGGRGSETGGVGTRRRAHVQQTTAGGHSPRAAPALPLDVLAAVADPNNPAARPRPRGVRWNVGNRRSPSPDPALWV